jgi:predicted small secreted protein
MKTMFRKIIAIGCCVTASALCACNTVEGIGKDIKKGGETIERVAK